jgi:Kef-type K+ transport system membrane component KefB
VLTVVGLLFLVSAEAGVGKAKKDRKSSVVTTADFVFITLFTSRFLSLFPFDCGRRL